jgi:hypothetical protein
MRRDPVSSGRLRDIGGWPRSFVFAGEGVAKVVVGEVIILSDFGHVPEQGFTLAQ